MADIRQTAEEGFHEIQLSGKQLVFLFMATVLVSSVIFLCGVLVGRGVRAEKNPEPGPDLAAAPAPAPPAAPGAAADAPPAPPPEADELSYHRRLEAAGTPAEQLKPEPAAPAPVPPAEPPAPSRPAAAAGTGPADGYFVQVAALREADEADALVLRLARKGYPAYRVEPDPASPVRLFRVRVGRYAERREADAIARRLEKEEQFKPIVRREF